MKISHDMDLRKLAETMGNNASREEAEMMREFLVVSDYAETQEIKKEVWMELLDIFAQGIVRSAEMSNF